MAQCRCSWRYVIARSAEAPAKSSICPCSTRCSRSSRPKRRSTGSRGRSGSAPAAGRRPTSPRNVFRTKDGRYIGISASIQAMAERLFRAIGREDVIADPRFRTNSDRVRNAEACEAPIVAFIGARTLAENMEIFERAEVTPARGYNIAPFLADPHLIARQILVDLPDA